MKYLTDLLNYFHVADFVLLVTLFVLVVFHIVYEANNFLNGEHIITKKCVLYIVCMFLVMSAIDIFQGYTSYKVWYFVHDKFLTFFFVYLAVFAYKLYSKFGGIRPIEVSDNLKLLVIVHSV